MAADDVPVVLIWIRKRNCSNRALMAWFEPFWSETLSRLEQVERVIELRGETPARPGRKVRVLDDEEIQIAVTERLKPDPTYGRILRDLRGLCVDRREQRKKGDDLSTVAPLQTSDSRL